MLTHPLSLFRCVRRRSCGSSFVCDCVDQPQFEEWYALDCAAAAASNTSFSINATTGVSDINTTALGTTPSTMFDNVKPLSILVALVTGLAMLALIALSVLFARYRKRNKVVVDLTKQAKDAKEEADKHEQGKFAAEKATQQAEREKAALQDKLYAAKKLIDQVMEEGGKLLDSYHLDYSDIDFGGDDVKEWRKLGEGAQVVINATTSPHLPPPAPL